jgi:PAS domain S-box-containing protein
LTWLRRISFPGLLLLTMLAVSLGGLALVSWVSFGVHRRVTDELNAALVQQTLLRVTDRLDELVRTSIHHAELYPQLAPDGELTAAEFPQLFDRLLSTVAPHEELSYLGVGIAETGEYGMVRTVRDEPVEIRTYVRDPETGPQIRDYVPGPQGLQLVRTLPWTRDGDPRTSYDLRLRPFYLQATKARRSIWTDSYDFWGSHEHEATPGVTYATPVYDADGRLKLVWDIDVELATLSRFLTRVQRLVRGHLLIAEHRSDGSWKVIAQPTWEAGDLLSADTSAAIDLWLARLPGNYQQMEQRNLRLQMLAVNGRPWGVVHSTLSGPDRPEWVVVELWPVSVQPQPASLSSAEFVVAFCAVGLIASICAWGLSRVIAKPLLELERDARRLAEGESTRIHPHGGTQEIARLAETLNDLERQVQDRQSRLKQTNTELRISRQRLQAHFDHTPVGAMEMDVEGRFIRWNPAATRIFGWTAEEVLGRRFDFIVPPAIRPQIDDVWRNLVNRSGGFRSENQNVTKDGGSIDCIWYNTPLIDEAGRVFGVACLVLDVTASKQADAEIRRLNQELEHRVVARTAQLAQAVRELETFSYSVAHDLRAPLRTIAGFSQALEEDCGDRLRPAEVEHLDRIRAATHRMAELIDTLLTLARVTRQEIADEPIDLSELARQAVQRLQQAEPERTVDVTIAPNLIVQGDRALLKILIGNLFDNAWKYTRLRQRARIEFGCHDGPQGREFFVRDNGVGFDPQFATNLFQPFQRLHRSDEFEGHGVGLATVQRIVEKHGGTVCLEGEPDRGATCWFTLPEARG